jgi:hypothetical protein
MRKSQRVQLIGLFSKKSAELADNLIIRHRGHCRLREDDNRSGALYGAERTKHPSFDPVPSHSEADGLFRYHNGVSGAGTGDTGRKVEGIPPYSSLEGDGEGCSRKTFSTRKHSD